MSWISIPNHAAGLVRRSITFTIQCRVSSLTTSRLILAPAVDAVTGTGTVTITRRNGAVHDDLIEPSKRLRHADGEVFHHEPTAHRCHRFRGFRRPAATGNYPADCTERHPGANRIHSRGKSLCGFGSSESCELRGMGTLDRRKVNKDGGVARGRGRQ